MKTRKLRGVLALITISIFSIAAICIFVSPIYFAFQKYDALQMLALLVTWIPAFFVFYVGVFLTALIDG